MTETLNGVVGSEHDFSYWHNGVNVADIWHSDKGEWTVATTIGHVWRKRTRAEAIELAERLSTQAQYAGG